MPCHAVNHDTPHAPAPQSNCHPFFSHAPPKAVVTPKESPASSWIRVYTAFGMADLFGAHDE